MRYLYERFGGGREVVVIFKLVYIAVDLLIYFIVLSSSGVCRYFINDEVFKG